MSRPSEDKQAEMDSAAMSAADDERLGGETYGRTAVDYELYAQDLAEFAAYGLTVCPDCEGWGYCGRCNDNGYLSADGQMLPWGAMEREVGDVD